MGMTTTEDTMTDTEARPVAGDDSGEVFTPFGRGTLIGHNGCEAYVYDHESGRRVEVDESQVTWAD
jgi:hypothetical protein